MKKEVEYFCNNCNGPLGYEPEYCCSGFDCGCRGQADPMACSNKCFDEMYGEKTKLVSSNEAEHKSEEI